MRSLIAVVALMAAAGAAHASADLTKNYNCTACHAEAAKKVGPAYKAVAEKYAGKADAVAYVTEKIQKGGKGVWGPVPMPAQPKVTEADAKAMAAYILGLK